MLVTNQIYTAKSTGHAFYLIETGEASTNPPPPFFTSPRNYNDGEIFGERALTESPCIRDETVTAVGEMTAYYLSREDFEKELCPLVELQLAQLRADPRTLIAQFYQQGKLRTKREPESNAQIACTLLAHPTKCVTTCTTEISPRALVARRSCARPTSQESMEFHAERVAIW